MSNNDFRGPAVEIDKVATGDHSYTGAKGSVEVVSRSLVHGGGTSLLSNRVDLTEKRPNKKRRALHAD